MERSTIGEIILEAETALIGFNESSVYWPRAVIRNSTVGRILFRTSFWDMNQANFTVEDSRVGEIVFPSAIHYSWVTFRRCWINDIYLPYRSWCDYSAIYLREVRGANITMNTTWGIVYFEINITKSNLGVINLTTEEKFGYKFRLFIKDSIVEDIRLKHNDIFDPFETGQVILINVTVLAWQQEENNTNETNSTGGNDTGGGSDGGTNGTNETNSTNSTNSTGGSTGSVDTGGNSTNETGGVNGTEGSDDGNATGGDGTGGEAHHTTDALDYRIALPKVLREVAAVFMR